MACSDVWAGPIPTGLFAGRAVWADLAPPFAGRDLILLASDFRLPVLQTHACSLHPFVTSSVGRHESIKPEAGRRRAHIQGDRVRVWCGSWNTRHAHHCHALFHSSILLSGFFFLHWDLMYNCVFCTLHFCFTCP